MSYHQVSFIEMRIIGCLIEKEITTPDQYPLSLNGLVNACNQKSNREPVSQFTELDVQDALDGLVSRGLVTEILAPHSRVSKYQHRFCNTEFSDLQLSSAETAVICLLFLRGAQTPGELRSRSGRLHSFADREEVEQALSSLQNRAGGPYVCQLAREAGQRELRYQECFCTEHEAFEQNVAPQTPVLDESYTEQLELRVLLLEETLEGLIERIQQLENASRL